MTWWALWDRLIPVAAVVGSGWLSYRLGYANGRLEREDDGAA